MRIFYKLIIIGVLVFCFTLFREYEVWAQTAEEQAQDHVDQFNENAGCGSGGECASYSCDGDTCTVTCSNATYDTHPPLGRYTDIPPEDAPEPPPDVPDIPTDFDLPTPVPTEPPTQATATPTNAPTATPVPTATLTPTPLAACGTTCKRDSDCDGGAARQGCNICDTGSGKCVAPSPTVTPTRAPTATPSPTALPTNTPTPTSSPTPTPTPFNPAACKCDGIEYTDIFSGQPTTITSFGKVEGADTSKAIIKDQKFYFAEGAETIAKIIGRSDPIPATVVSSSPEKVRFQSKWSFTLPQLKSGATYRIWSQINCQPKLAFTPSKKVAAAETYSKSFIDRMIDFLNNLFGRGPAATTSQVSPTPGAGEGFGMIMTEPTPTSKRSLQLETIYPGEVYQKTCSFIKFRFGQPSQ